jgi:hypothetical protein
MMQIFVPRGCKTIYNLDKVWSRYNSIIEMSIADMKERRGIQSKDTKKKDE